MDCVRVFETEADGIPTCAQLPDRCRLCVKMGGNLIFFFSSRRRHTRFDCDWSSDVCSSDLGHAPRLGAPPGLGLLVLVGPGLAELPTVERGLGTAVGGDEVLPELALGLALREIGRASRRERG